MKVVIDMIRGFCMAMADSVPGVSGGTIAFLMGFYDKFINSLNDLISGKKEKKIEALKFLIKLGIGWGVGFVACVLILTELFNTYIYEISSLFIGLTLFAIPVVFIEEKHNLKGKYWTAFFAIIGAALVFCITYFNPTTGGDSGVNLGQPSFQLGISLFFTAMIAITAMVLPGISGSTLLLIFGFYVPIITSIKELLHLHFEYLPMIIVFGLGVIAGIVLVIKLVKLCLEKFRAQTIFFIFGLMIGSIYAIVMGPTTLDEPKPMMDFSTFSVLPFILGGVIVVGLQLFKNFKNKKQISAKHQK